MTNNEKDKPTFAKQSPWGNFLWLIIELDKTSKKPDGWYWLISLHYLLGIGIRDMQDQLPDKHPLKKAPLPTTANKKSLKPTIAELSKSLGNPKEIKKIDFSRLKFKKAIDFSNFIFPINTDFSKAKFLHDAIFKNAIFFNTADFENTQFHKEKTSHLRTAKFRNTTFKKIANFSNATFWKYANFKGATFEGRTSFQKAEFKFNAPRFYGATFNNEMTFSGMIPPKFRRAPNEKHGMYLKETADKWVGKWTGQWAHKQVGKPFGKWIGNWAGKQVGQWVGKWTSKCAYKCAGKWAGQWVYKQADKQKKKKQYRDRIQENQNSYENTAILLDINKKYHDQHFFFRQEMRCRWRLEKNTTRPFYWLYGLFANYGYGVGHAFIAWLVHICIWATVLFFTVFKDKCTIYERFSCSVITSLSNAHSFFLSKGERLSSCYNKDDITLEFNLVWAFETIFGALFLFLLLLTLRIRFRLK